MKVTRSKSLENRENILKVAGIKFREHGFDGIGVADLMKEAGLTVGGFYKNFESKEDLLIQACEAVFENSKKKWNGYLMDPQIQDPYKRVGSAYLSSKNRDDLSTTCIFSTVGAEVSRHSPALEKLFAENMEGVFQFLTNTTPDGNEAAKREQAIATFSQWVGALLLSRMVANNPLSDEILQVAKKNTGLV